jgi:hypothetical protein
MSVIQLSLQRNRFCPEVPDTFALACTTILQNAGLLLAKPFKEALLLLLLLVQRLFHGSMPKKLKFTQF